MARVSRSVDASLRASPLLTPENAANSLESRVFSLAFWFKCGRFTLVMATTTKRTRFSRRLPDHVTDELVSVLMEDKIFPFNELFERTFEKLKLRNAVSGGEEMLRLRAYEKLQNLVTRGLVEKIGKEYKGSKRVNEAHSDFANAEEI